MSARNYLSAREKNISKLIDCLPNINQQKFGYRSGQELPPLSANTSNFVNRNLNYSFEVQPYMVNSLERAGTPFSDFFSESETGKLVEILLITLLHAMPKTMHGYLINLLK